MAGLAKETHISWTSDLPEDRRFRRILGGTSLIVLILSIAITLVTMPKPVRPKAPPVPPNIVKLLQQKKPEPKKVVELTEEQKLALKQAEEERRKKEEEERRKREEEARKQKELDEQKLAELRKKQEEERKRREELEKQRLAKMDDDKRRQEELRRQQEEQRRQQEALRKQKEAEARARQEAERKAKEQAAGRKAATEALADLRDVFEAPAPTAATKGTQPLAKGGEKAAAPAAPAGQAITSRTAASASKSSGGINTNQLASAVEVDSGGGRLAARETTEIAAIDFGVAEGGAGAGTDADSATRNSGTPSRTARELNEVMERYKGRMSALYQRALRSNPALGGKLVVRMTIQPDGSVSGVEISGDMDDAELLAKLKKLIEGINFGAKDVGIVVANYPIDFAML